jgi:hypothetical protein
MADQEMPWAPELFSAPMLARMLEERGQRESLSVPFYDGIVAGEFDALIGSFAGEPELHHPVRGRIRGVRAFKAYVSETNAWLRERHISIEDVERVIGERDGFEEVVLHLDGDQGRIDLPVAIVADKQPGGRLNELRIYYSSWPLTGRHMNRPPLLQADPALREPGVIAAYGRALSAGDLRSILATFEPDGCVREPAGRTYLHTGQHGLRDFFEPLFSNGGGIPLEMCAAVDGGRACALEYNVLGWGKAAMPPQAGVGVFVRGESGRLAAVRLYDDVDRPVGARKPSDLAA